MDASDDVSSPGYGGVVVGAPAVAGDSLVVVMNPEGAPYAAAGSLVIAYRLPADT